MVGEQLKRDVEQDRIEFGLGGGDGERGIDSRGRVAGMSDGEDRPAPCADFLDRREVLRIKIIARDHRDRRGLGRNQRQRAVLELGGRIGLGVQVADLLELSAPSSATA